MYVVYILGHVLGAVGFLGYLAFVFYLNKKAEKPQVISVKKHVGIIASCFAIYNVAFLSQCLFLVIPMALLAGGFVIWSKLTRG